MRIMDKQYDPYLMEGTREELLEQFYALMKSTDAIFDMKEALMDAGELEAWGELSALEYALRKSDKN